MPELPLSAVILTRNEELNLPRCLESLAGWCGDVHVLDSGSDDRTVDIAREFGATITQHAFLDHPSQWAWALDNLVLNEWVLALDADHVVSKGLADEMGRVLRTVVPSVDGFYIPHQYFFRGRRVRGLKGHWLQLVRRGSARPDRSELVDSRFLVRGETRKLSNPIVEDNVRELSIQFWTEKHVRYARRAAVEEVLRKRDRLGWDTRPRLLGTADERVVWAKRRWYRLPLGFRPLLEFVFRYVGRGGFLDGRVGLLFHVLHSLWYRLLVDVTVSDLERQLAEGSLSLDALYEESRLT